MRALVLVALLGAAAPCAAQDRWQVELHSGAYLWDLELLKLSGDTLLVRQTDSDATLRLPVMQIEELRLVAESAQRAGVPDPRAVEGGLMGTGDLAFRLTLRSRAERIAIVRAALARRPAGGP